MDQFTLPGFDLAAFVTATLDEDLGVGLPGGSQQAYASLVDLSNGRIVWFNQLRRASGDLREAAKAAESIGTLLNDFPEAK